MNKVIADRTVSKILLDIFATMIHLKLEEVPEGLQIPSPFSGVTANVSVTGEEHRLIVVLFTSEKLACLIHGAMLDTESTEWNSEVADALGEIVNIVGGNFKATLAPPSLSLSFPAVIRGKEFDWSAPEVSVIHEESFRVEGEPLIVRIVEETH